MPYFRQEDFYQEDFYQQDFPQQGSPEAPNAGEDLSLPSLRPLPEILVRSWSSYSPEGTLPPGPRMNPWRHCGAQAVHFGGRLRDLCTAMWRRGDFHTLPDGTRTNIPQRPIPSAGATYPVHTHIVAGTNGLDGLAPGRYVYDHEKDQLLRRDTKKERRAGLPEASSLPCDSVVVLTVQPGRSFGRYRHRAWPLWIADAAYAHEALTFLLGELDVTLDGPTGPSPQLRQLLGLPAAAATELWMRCGIIPEIPLVALTLPTAWRIDPQRRRALAHRRSPGLAEFVTKGHGSQAAERIAAASGQSWVRHADRVETWSIPTTASAGELREALWRGHQEAARLVYESALSGQWRCRPVSGIPAKDNRWTVHALAMLAPDTSEEATS